ncbi:MAG: PorT family protein [Prevotellaceae bacterium]|nr:PorT family protein [Prevotellaceae bacterium]
MLVAATPLHAQFSAGVKAGGTFARLQPQEESGNAYGWSNSYHAGLALNVYLASFSFGGFAVQPEALYNRKGRDGLYLSYGEASLGIIYLLNFGSVIPYISFAPYYAFLLSARSSRQGDSRNFAGSDYGLKLGGGVELQRVQVSASYAWGLYNIAGGGASSRNVSTEISLGYFFLQ